MHRHGFCAARNGRSILGERLDRPRRARRLLGTTCQSLPIQHEWHPLDLREIMNPRCGRIHRRAPASRRTMHGVRCATSRPSSAIQLVAARSTLAGGSRHLTSGAHQAVTSTSASPLLPCSIRCWETVASGLARHLQIFVMAYRLFLTCRYS